MGFQTRNCLNDSGNLEELSKPGILEMTGSLQLFNETESDYLEFADFPARLG